jgi:hypothetical protein
MAGLTRPQFGPPRAQQRGDLVQRRFILDGRRQTLLDGRALSPLHGEAANLGAAD